MRGLLGVGEADGFSASRAIVLNRAAPVAIAVDSVDGFVAIPTDGLETRPIELAAETGEFLKGAFQADSLVAKVLDIKRLFETAFVRRERPHPQSQPRVASAKGERVEPLDTEVLVTFDVADQEYALGLDAVREIVPAPDNVTTVPRAEAVVVGMMPYRGQLLPLLSLRGLLGFANAAERTGREKVVVACVGGTLVGLMADRARAIVSAERRLIDPLPSASGGSHRRRSEDQSRLSRRFRTKAHFDPPARATVSGGCHASTCCDESVRDSPDVKHR